MTRGFLPYRGGGNTSTYFCDYTQIAAKSIAVYGGSYATGGSAGIFCLTVNDDDKTITDREYGARLMYL